MSGARDFERRFRSIESRLTDLEQGATLAEAEESLWRSIADHEAAFENGPADAEWAAVLAAAEVYGRAAAKVDEQ